MDTQIQERPSTMKKVRLVFYGPPKGDSHAVKALVEWTVEWTPDGLNLFCGGKPVEEPLGAFEEFSSMGGMNSRDTDKPWQEYSSLKKEEPTT